MATSHVTCDLCGEAVIFINGRQLTTGQAMTLRVAIGMRILDLYHGCLGADDHSKKITELYLARAREIEALLTMI